MKEYFSFPLSLALLFILCAPLSVVAQDIVIPEGTRLNLQLNADLSTSKNKEGDTFTAVVTKPVSLAGRIVIPKGSVVNGSTARILRDSKFKGATMIKLSFQSIDIPGRGNIAIVATLVDKDAKVPGNIRSEGFIEKKDSAASKVIRVVTPTGIGVGIGSLAGGGKGAKIGAGIGLAVGIATNEIILNGGNIEIRRGSMLVIELTRPLRIPRERAAIRTR